MSRLELPSEHRERLKEPAGPLYSDPAELLATVDEPVISVGDVVTAHLLSAGCQPTLAIVDYQTEREAVAEDVAATLTALGNEVGVDNPAGGLTFDFLDAIVAGIETPEPRTIAVDGEEDLATIPAVIAAPEGATVVYGQPGEGMVAVAVNADTQATFLEHLDHFEGNVERAREILGVGR